MIVKQIDTRDTYSLRSSVLREGRPIESCHFAKDNDEGTFHLGAYVSEKLVSVASFYIDNNPLIEGELHYRLRGMATLEEYRRQGHSLALIKTAIPAIKQNGVSTLWCNARTSAVAFYKKVGFTTIGEEFHIEDVGPHYLMVKHLY